MNQPDTFKQNWAFAETYLPAIKTILKSQAAHIVEIEIATPEEDMKQSTDLKVRISSGDVAVRIRRNTTFRDLTIRAYNHGMKTEIHKLREGFARWYLYAWTTGNEISEWVLVDIDILRNAGLLSEDREITMNKDGCTGFIAYKKQELEEVGAIVSVNPTDRARA